MIALTGPAVEALARDPAPSFAPIDDAIAARDYDTAFAHAIARLVGGRELPTTTVAKLLEGDPEPYIALHLAGKATGERALLLDAIERGRVPYQDTIITLLYAVWRTGDREALRARIVRILRIYMAELEDPEAAALLAILVEELADPDVSALAKILGVERDKEAEPFIANAHAEPVSKLVAALPLEAPAKNVGFTVRTQEKPGRNEPCWCGSGKKYKKCCADKPEDTRSPLANMSWEAYLRDGAGEMSVEDVEGLSYGDLVRVQLTKLQPLPLHRALLRFVRRRDWEYALRALDAKAALDPEDAAEHTFDVLAEAIEANDIEAARAIRARIPAGSAAGHDLLEYELLVDKPADALDRIERVAREALASEQITPAYNLAFAIMKSYPALGILVGNDLVRADQVLDSETMVFYLERARAQLGLPFDQRISDRWEKIVDDYLAAQKRDERKRAGRAQRRRGKSDTIADDEAAREARALRSSLVAENERATRLERELAAAREALATASKPSTTTAVPARGDLDMLRSMRDRVQNLEALIREGNEERALLRKKLESTAKPAEAPKPVVAPALAPEDDPGDPVESRGRRVCVPIFKPDAIRSLEDLPAAVAALAIRTTGELAAADDGAWHQVKQARDMTTPIYMARIGIHHRLLFEIREGRLEVIDVITRETLLHVLKRIRSR